MNKIGIKQGRLSPRQYPKLQAFPWKTWEGEFETAAQIGYDFIEIMFDEENYEDNPIWSNNGRKKIRELIKQTGISVESVCADYFLAKPFFRRNGYSFESNIEVLRELIIKAVDIGASMILLPVLENSEIRSTEDEKILSEVIYNVIPMLENYGVRIGFETELEAERYLKLSSQFQSKLVGIYYDMGNCTACGYNVKQDIEVLKDYIIAVHIKDRMIGGKSVFLGTGDVKFSENIPELVKNGYCGNFVMETYFEDDYMGVAANNLKFIRSLIEQ